MSKQEIIKIFGDRKVRSVWDDEAEKWYFSVVDVVAVLTDSENPRNYWKVLKNRLKKEGNKSVTNCNQLKLKAVDGKFYKTDVADQEQLFRFDLAAQHGRTSRGCRQRRRRGEERQGRDRAKDGTQDHFPAQRIGRRRA